MGQIWRISIAKQTQKKPTNPGWQRERLERIAVWGGSEDEIEEQ
jgi:hypothetical protein